MSDLPTNLDIEKWYDNLPENLTGEQHKGRLLTLTIPEVKDLVQSICLSVIGEDEPVPESIFYYGDDDQRKWWYNRLRAEQRLSLKEKINGTA